MNMVVTGIIKNEGRWWSAHVDDIGAFTQGRSKKAAMVMLEDLVMTMIDWPGVIVMVRDIGASSAGIVSVIVETNAPLALAARVLRYQRAVHGR